MAATILARTRMTNSDPEHHVNRPTPQSWMPESVLQFLGMSNGTIKPMDTFPLCDAVELESRVLYSGSPMPVDAESLEALEPTVEVEFTDDLASEPVDSSQQQINDFLGEVTQSLLSEINADDGQFANSDASEILFVDGNIPEFESFFEQIQEHFSGRNDVQIVALTGSDGVQQITQTLAGQSNIRAVHIVSHGADGQVNLGDTTLNAGNLSGYASEIASWSQSLSENADLMFYGCDLAASEAGQEFLESIAVLTEADVAASTDTTGHESLDGDWDLEFEFGQIESSVIVSNRIQAGFLATLPVVDVIGSGDSAIWLSTRAAASADGGVFWDSSLAVQFGGPNFELENGGTGGVFSLTGFDSPVGIRGLHLVESALIQVGDATLQQGDLLLAIDTNHNFGFAADRHDILVFRPDVANDYSSGVYSMFLDEGVHDGAGGLNVHALSLIEKEIVIGGQTLTQGTLLVARSGGTTHDNLYTVNIVTSSFGTSGVTNTGSTSLFIDGSKIGFDDEMVQSIEVLEEAVQLGDEIVAKGSILLSIDTNGNMDVGDNNESIQGEDIFALTVSATENTGGTAANARLLFNGSDVGLSVGSNDENINGLTVINSLSTVDNAPIAMDDAYSVNEDSTLDSDDDWFDSNWTNRRTLSFDNLAQTENLTDFPVLVTLDASRIDYSQTQNNGQDLRFIDGDGTLLAYEIEEWNESGTSYVWVKLPQIDGSSNTDYVHMYYGNAAAAAGQNAANVWDGNHQGVWHLDETSGQHDDSTANDHELNSFGGVDQNATGQVSGANNFDGIDDYLFRPNNNSNLHIRGDVTLEAWIRMDALPTADWAGIVELGGINSDLASQNFLYTLSVHADGEVALGHESGAGLNHWIDTGVILDSNQWYHLSAVRDASALEWELFVDGTQAGSYSYTQNATGGGDGDVFVGRDDSNFKGTIDEIRISDVARSADWIAHKMLPA